MSFTEVAVIAVALVIGYKYTSSLMSKSEKRDAPAPEVQASPPVRRWHDVLGVSPTASREEIVGAYRSLISQYHPDKVATLGEEFRELAERRAKEINAAYDEAHSRDT